MRLAESESNLPIELRYGKLLVVADRRTFKVCEVKEKEIGFIRKSFVYVHFDGKRWSILKINASLSMIEYYILE